MTHEVGKGKSEPQTGILSDEELAARYPAFTVTDILGNKVTVPTGYQYEIQDDNLFVYQVNKETWKMNTLVAIYNGWIRINIIAE
jgi:hypothetical protein